MKYLLLFAVLFFQISCDNDTDNNVINQNPNKVLLLKVDYETNT